MQGQGRGEYDFDCGYEPHNPQPTTTIREVSQAGTSTMRGYFGCGCVFEIMQQEVYTEQMLFDGPCATSVVKEKSRAAMRICTYAWLRHINCAMYSLDQGADWPSMLQMARLHSVVPQVGPYGAFRWPSCPNCYCMILINDATN